MSRIKQAFHKEVKDRTPLHEAAEHGQDEIVHLICQNVTEKNPPDANGLTPLHLGAKNGHFNCVVEISQSVDNSHPKSKTGETPLDLALEANKKDVVEFFIERHHLAGPFLK